MKHKKQLKLLTSMVQVIFTFLVLIFIDITVLKWIIVCAIAVLSGIILTEISRRESK